MSSMTTDRAEEIVAGWRRDADAVNPAGPLFGGPYTESEIAMVGSAYTMLETKISICTGSGWTQECC